MPKLKVDWSRQKSTDVNPTLRRFERWLVEHGYRDACILTYTSAVEKFLGVVKSANPTPDDAATWHGDLAESNLARSTVNIWGTIIFSLPFASLLTSLTIPKILPKRRETIPFSDFGSNPML
jgi:hypothetical protein